MAAMEHEPQEAVLVLDAGTGSGRAGLVTADGRVVARAARSWAMPVTRDGSQDLPVAMMAERLDEAVAEVLTASDAPPVRAVATTSVRGAFVLLDRDGTVLWAVGSGDARARDEVRTMLPMEPAFHAATGQKVVLAALPRLRWLARHRSDILERATELLTLEAWLARRLGGSSMPASVSNASTTGLLDLGTRAWGRPEGMPWYEPGDERFAAWLPALAESGEIGATVSAEARDRLGLPAGIPIAVGGGDTQMAATGLGCVRPGDTAVVMGSNWQSVRTLDHAVPDPQSRYRVIAHAIRGRWQSDAIAWSAGSFLDWYARAFATEGDLTTDRSGTHERLAAEGATLAPGADGVLAVGGLPMTRPAWVNAAPSLLGFSLAEAGSARAAGYRAIIEAGCFAVAANLDLISGDATVTPDQEPIRVAGGVSRSDLACGILAAVTGRVLARSETPEASMIGAAACAAVAAGWYPDVADAASAMARSDRRYEPDAASYDAYQAVAARWRAAASAQEALAADGITTPVWKPAS
jgi:autoinducer 2 (AI-2) kinase